MNARSLPREWNILLADDDKDNCLLFTKALSAALTILHHSDQLMRLFTNRPSGKHRKSEVLFDVLFLDLNMPRKNGFTCLEEIKQNNQLKSRPGSIFSTSYNAKEADLLYKTGAQHYSCKPTAFSDLKTILQEALERDSENIGLHNDGYAFRSSSANLH